MIQIGRLLPPAVRTKTVTSILWIEIIFFVLPLVSCSQYFSSPPKLLLLTPKPGATLTMVGFEQLLGWGAGRENQALAAFLKSCKKLSKLPADAFFLENKTNAPSRVYGRGFHWHEVCEKARRLIPNLTPADAKKYFETYFVPYRMSNKGNDDGLITGYFEPRLLGSRKPTRRFWVPLYKKPGDLVSIDLGDFRQKWKGEQLIGKVKNSKLVPYEERSEIEEGSLKGRNLELLWVEDPVEAFFLHIQGSGSVVFPDGKQTRVGYAGKNGQPYFAIGRDLVARGVLTKTQVSLQSIRSWLKRHPEEAQALMNKNKSYVFFRAIQGPGPIGAQGIPLTPGHSLATDKRFVPLGTPVWLDTINPLLPGVPLRRLVIAQDTGGAIKGVVRADLFWGAGRRARQGAGRMKEMGRLYILLPRAALAGRRN